ncbi:unnamed protein product [Eretmochelys imbricata]
MPSQNYNVLYIHCVRVQSEGEDFTSNSTQLLQEALSKLPNGLALQGRCWLPPAYRQNPSPPSMRISSIGLQPRILAPPSKLGFLTVSTKCYSGSCHHLTLSELSFGHLIGVPHGRI